MIFRFILCIGIVLCSSHTAFAHEFWVAPETYTPQLGAPIAVGLKVGQMMKGADYPYLSDKFQSFTITTRKSTRNAEGVEGDIPAITYTAEEPGLHIIAFHASPYPITFDTFPEFYDYLIYEGLGDIGQAHKTRGLPEIGITERYIRYAKALIQVGSITDADNDRSLGLQFELIAETNPYSTDLKVLPVLLLWNGKPMADRQISIFNNNGAVTRTLVTTDTEGRALIPLIGGGQFLLNSVQMIPIPSGETMWESHWASLTFGLPPRN